MVDRRGRVFLMDLGLAKSLGDESGMTLSGSTIGTPQYMSPEQAQGLADLGVPTDVYALGATLYHLVTGTPPFTGDTTPKVLHQHLHEPLPPPRQRNPKLTDACSYLLETMLAKEPAGRYGDWRALIADLDRVLQGKLPSRDSLEPAVHSGAAGASAGSPAVSRVDLARQAQQALARQHRAQTPKPAGAPGAHASAKRPPWLAIGLAAALVVVLALLGALKKPNELGLYDLSANVWEWCLDSYDVSYYVRSHGTDPVNLLLAGDRVGRGGGWDFAAVDVRSVCRFRFGPDRAGYSLGFRVCLGPAIPAAAP